MTGHERRRRRATAGQGPPPAVREAAADGTVERDAPPAAAATAAEAAAVSAPGSVARPGIPAAAQAHRRRPTPRAGGLRDLVGSGASQVGISAALRARDVNRPTDDDLAEAERETVIIRRNGRGE